jgi:hypothetical protein
MQNAARERPDTGENVRIVGVRFESYLPNYFLGVALFQLGNCQGALEKFNAAEQLGAVTRNNNYYNRLKDLRGRIGPNGPCRVSVSTTSTVPVTAATTAPSTTTIMAATSVPVTTSAPPLTTVPGIPPQLIAAAQAAVTAAVNQRQTVEAIPDIVALRKIDAAVADADQVARRNLDAALAKLQTSTAGNLSDVQDVASAAQQATVTFQMETRLARSTVTRIVGELVKATTPYFAGQYDVAETALAGLNYPDSRFEAQVRLFRAAAAYAHLASSAQDDKLRQRAEADARESRRLLPPRFQLDPAVFSPKFIEFFSAVR